MDVPTTACKHHRSEYADAVISSPSTSGSFSDLGSCRSYHMRAECPPILKQNILSVHPLGMRTHHRRSPFPGAFVHLSPFAIPAFWLHIADDGHPTDPAHTSFIRKVMKTVRERNPTLVAFFYGKVGGIATAQSSRSLSRQHLPRQFSLADHPASWPCTERPSDGIDAIVLRSISL